MKRLRTLALTLTLLAGSTPDVRAQAVGAFARMGFGARGVAMGNGLVADAFGDASPYYNPALAPFTSRQNLAASAAFLSRDRELQFLQFAAPLRPQAGIALGLIHAGVSEIDGRDASGYHTRDLSTDEFAFFLAFGTRLGGRATAGVGLQLFRTDLFDELEPVISIGLDIGVTVRVTEQLRLGLAADDLLARYAWDTTPIYDEDGTTTRDRFPARLRVGGAYALMEGRVRLLAEVESRVTSAEARTRQTGLDGGGPVEIVESERLRLQSTHLRVGGEVFLSEPFALRAGLGGLGTGNAGASPTAGFMVEQAVGSLIARAEYAFVLEPYAAGAMHLLTLKVFL